MWSAHTIVYKRSSRLQGLHSGVWARACVASSPENRVSLRGVEVTLCGPHTSPNVDVLPLTRKKLREYILVSSLGYPFLTYIIVLVS